MPLQKELRENCPEIPNISVEEILLLSREYLVEPIKLGKILDNERFVRDTAQGIYRANNRSRVRTRRRMDAINNSLSRIEEVRNDEEDDFI